MLIEVLKVLACFLLPFGGMGWDPLHVKQSAYGGSHWADDPHPSCCVHLELRQGLMPALRDDLFLVLVGVVKQLHPCLYLARRDGDCGVKSFALFELAVVKGPLDRHGCRGSAAHQPSCFSHVVLAVLDRNFRHPDRHHSEFLARLDVSGGQLPCPLVRLRDDQCPLCSPSCCLDPLPLLLGRPP